MSGERVEEICRSIGRRDPFFGGVGLYQNLKSAKSVKYSSYLFCFEGRKYLCAD